jgi:prepilin-type N-terminal cleavage/methylation domain-containing protein
MVSKRYSHRLLKHDCAARPHAGFTLVELMIVISLILLLAVMTASAINTSISGDKVRGGARQVQSFLGGARDRAIYSKAPRGVRFLLDSTNNRTVSSMVYIAPTDDWTQGTIQMEWKDGIVKVVRGFDNDTSGLAIPTGWLNLYNQGLLKNGIRIKIPDNNTGEWYTVNTSLLATATPSDIPRLQLLTKLSIAATQTANQSDFQPAFQSGTGPTTYRLELPPTVLPNQEPVLLPYDRQSRESGQSRR